MSSRKARAAVSNSNITSTPAVSSAAGKGTQEAEVKQKELVPGKLTEKDWDNLIAVDDGIETVYELVEEVVQRASDIVFERYIEAEIYPYAVRAVKKSILKIIALEFVARDEGEKNTDTDPTWLPSERPVPPPIDSWACGVIPMASPESLCSFMDALDPIQVHQPVNPEEEKEVISMRSTTSTIPSSLTSTIKTGKSTAKTSTAASRKKRIGSKMPELPSGVGVGLRRSQLEAKLVPLERPPDGVTDVNQEESHQQIPSQAHSIPAPLNEPNFTPYDRGSQQLNWIKGVKYDSKGNITEMVKLDPAKFPSYSTKAPRVSIIYPPKDAVRQGFAKQRAKFKSLDTYTSILKTTKGKPHGSKGSLTRSSHSEQASGDIEEKRYPGRALTVMPSDAGLSKKGSSRRFPSLPTLPALVDTIDPLPGITVRERGRVIHGPNPIYHFPISPGLPLRPVKPLVDGGMAGARKEVESKLSPRPHRSSATCTTY